MHPALCLSSLICAAGQQLSRWGTSMKVSAAHRLKGWAQCSGCSRACSSFSWSSTPPTSPSLPSCGSLDLTSNPLPSCLKRTRMTGCSSSPGLVAMYQTHSMLAFSKLQTGKLPSDPQQSVSALWAAMHCQQWQRQRGGLLRS